MSRSVTKIVSDAAVAMPFDKPGWPVLLLDRIDRMSRIWSRRRKGRTRQQMVAVKGVRGT